MRDGEDLEKNKLRLEHLERIRDDVRDEVKKRIRQRDNYSIQHIIALGVVFGASLSTEIQFADEIVLFAPFVSIYFTVLILYSYRSHRFLTTYLIEKIEPLFKELCNSETGIEIETYYKENHIPGTRKIYFYILMCIVIGLSLSYYGIKNYSDVIGLIIIIGSSISYTVASIKIFKIFEKDLCYGK